MLYVVGVNFILLVILWGCLFFCWVSLGPRSCLSHACAYVHTWFTQYTFPLFRWATGGGHGTRNMGIKLGLKCKRTRKKSALQMLYDEGNAVITCLSCRIRTTSLDFTAQTNRACGKPVCRTYQLAKLGPLLLCHPSCQWDCSNSTGLSDGNDALPPDAGLIQVLGDLSGLPRASLPWGVTANFKLETIQVLHSKSVEQKWSFLSKIFT